MIYNTLLVFSLLYINGFVRIPAREQVTYNWPCEKHGFSRLVPQTLSDCHEIYLSTLQMLATLEIITVESRMACRSESK